MYWSTDCSPWCVWLAADKPCYTGVPAAKSTDFEFAHGVYAVRWVHDLVRTLAVALSGFDGVQLVSGFWPQGAKSGQSMSMLTLITLAGTQIDWSVINSASTSILTTPQVTRIVYGYICIHVTILYYGCFHWSYGQVSGTPAHVGIPFS